MDFAYGKSSALDVSVALVRRSVQPGTFRRASARLLDVGFAVCLCLRIPRLPIALGAIQGRRLEDDNCRIGRYQLSHTQQWFSLQSDHVILSHLSNIVNIDGPHASCSPHAAHHLSMNSALG